MTFRRGDVVLVVAPGAYGKARPAVIVQADIFNVDAPSVRALSSALIAPPEQLTLQLHESLGRIIDPRSFVPRPVDDLSPRQSVPGGR